MPEPGKTSKTSSSAMDVDSDASQDLGVGKLSLGPGKSSDVHARFGVVGESSTSTSTSTAAKRKRGASDAEPAPEKPEKRSKAKKTPVTKGKQRAAQDEADAEVATDDTPVDPNAFKYQVRTSEHGSFEGDATPHLTNGVMTEADPRGPQPGNAYVGNVITVAQGKDKNPAKVAQQYAAEAFDDPTQAKHRFALVVGVNSMESVVRDQPGQLADLKAAVDSVTGFQEFPLTAFRRQWRPTWEVAAGKDKGQEVAIETVRNEARAHTDAATAQEKKAKKDLAPVGPMRTETRKDSNTLAYQDALRKRFKSVYVHVGDSDAINLKAPALPGDKPSGLFDRYDSVIHDAKKGKPDAPGPKVVTGGYKFRVADKYLPEGQGHDDPHAGSAGRVAPQTAAGSELDMSLRQSLFPHVPSKVYLPEPNMLVRGDAYQDADFGPTNKDESKHALASLAQADKPKGKGKDKVAKAPPPATPAWTKNNVVFDNRAALYTDGARFDEGMSHDITRKDGEIKTKKVNDYGRGKTDIEGLTNTNNLQSHARIRALINIISHMNSNVLPLLNVYLPQKVAELEAEKQTGVSRQQTHDKVREYFALFDGIAGEMEKTIRELKDNKEIPKRFEKKGFVAPEGEDRDAAFKAKVDAQDAEAPKHAHHAEPHSEAKTDFAKAANIDLPALSAKLVVAGSAAKNFDKGKKLDEVLATCRAAGNAIAAFLATYQPQGPVLDETGARIPPAPTIPPPNSPATQPVASTSGPSGHAPMDVDSPRA